MNTFKNTSTAPSSSLGAMRLTHAARGKTEGGVDTKQDDKALIDGRPRAQGKTIAEQTPSISSQPNPTGAENCTSHTCVTLF